MNELQIIEKTEFLGKEIIIYGTVEEPLFKADDIAKWLEHSNVSKMLESVDKSEKRKIEIGTLTNSYSAWFTTEDGLYELFMLSRKPQAKPFKKKVKEMLKLVRKTGMYATDELLNNPDLAIKAFTRLKEEQDKRKQLEKQIEDQAPAVAFANSLSVSDDCILVREMAKLLKQKGVNTGEDRLFKYFRANGYLISKKGSDWNLPTQKSMNLGLFVIKEGTRQSASEGVKITKTPKITGKGQQYFINKFLG